MERMLLQIGGMIALAVAVLGLIDWNLWKTKGILTRRKERYYIEPLKKAPTLEREGAS